MTELEFELAERYRAEMKELYPGEVGNRIIKEMRLKGIRTTKVKVSQFWSGRATHKFKYFNVIEGLILKAQKEQKIRNKQIQKTLNQKS